MLYPYVFCHPVADVVKILFIDEDGPQGDAILGGARAEKVVKNHIQGLAVVNEALKTLAEQLVVAVASWHDDMDEAKKAVA